MQLFDTLKSLSAEIERLEEQTFGPVVLVVLQPTTFCNLDCDYCYLPDRHLKHTLSLDLLEPIFQNLFASPYIRGNFNIVWHAGEPLTLPISFYEAAFRKIDALSQKYNLKKYPYFHSIQTNGTLIDRAWCNFIQTYEVKIGISLDGLDFIHDKHRKTRTGLGTHASTMRGISYLQKNDIEFSIIAVLTQESLNYPDDLFQFFVDHQITRVGFNIEEMEGNHPTSSLARAGTDDRYRAFMTRFYELTQRSNCLKVREFDRVKKNILQGARIDLGQSIPYTIISIDYKGDYMTFSPELLSLESPEYGSFILGNVKSMSFEAACQTDRFQKINADIQAGVNACQQTCQYFSLCGGGAPANKYFENGSFHSTETIYCRYTQQILTDIVLEDLEKSLELA